MRVIDLFSGAGGLSLGFQQAGFEIIAAYDSWELATTTYELNVGRHAHHTIVSLDLELPAADVVIGGPPCQGFSSAGMRRTDDDRNSLVSVFANLVARVRPKAFVFENVEGFLTGANGRFVLELLDPLIEAGYQIHLRKVNAANYGVPQHRKRVVAIGGLGWEPRFPEPTHSAFGAPGSELLNRQGLAKTLTFADALRHLPKPSLLENTLDNDHAARPLEGDDLARARLLGPGQTMRDLPEELWHDSYKRRAFRRVMDGTPTENRGGAPAGIRRLRLDEPSKAITGGALREFLHPTEDRALTIRECAILQTFPDTFRFCGHLSDKIQLIGNAVPPLLARAIASGLRQDLTANDEPLSTGSLLTFQPTFSSGMSPILRKVTNAVLKRFCGTIPKERQKTLWD